MGNKGQITANGSYEELRKQGNEQLEEIINAYSSQKKMTLDISDKHEAHDGEQEPNKKVEKVTREK
jgi:predicted CopG family antitoxin